MHAAKTADESGSKKLWNNGKEELSDKGYFFKSLLVTFTPHIRAWALSKKLTQSACSPVPLGPEASLGRSVLTPVYGKLVS